MDSLHESMMQLAIDAANQANNEVPIGAVVVLDGEVIATASNAPIGTCDPTAHAEILALRQAAQKINNYRLVDTTLYVTLEPCMMCFGAMVHARVAHLVYGAADPKVGMVSTGLMAQVSGMNHQISVTGGVLASPCTELLKNFFKQKR